MEYGRYFLDEWQGVQQSMGFAQAVRSGDELHISGTVSVDADFVVAYPDSFDDQLRNIFEILGRTLAAHGLGFADVVRERMFVTDMDALVAAISGRKTFYGDGPYPASTAVEVRRLLHPDMKIEVELLAKFTTPGEIA